MISSFPCLDCGHTYQLSKSEANGESWVVRTHVCGDAREAEGLRRAGELQHRAMLDTISRMTGTKKIAGQSPQPSGNEGEATSPLV